MYHLQLMSMSDSSGLRASARTQCELRAQILLKYYFRSLVALQGRGRASRTATPSGTSS